jgi:hypothetical protein
MCTAKIVHIWIRFVFHNQAFTKAIGTHGKNELQKDEVKLSHNVLPLLRNPLCFFQ